MQTLAARLKRWPSEQPLYLLALAGALWFTLYQTLIPVSEALVAALPFERDRHLGGGALAGVPSVASVHDLHIWAVKAIQPRLSAHLIVQHIARWESVMDASHALLKEQFEVHHATLQPEPMTRTLHWRKRPGHEHEPD